MGCMYMGAFWENDGSYTRSEMIMQVLQNDPMNGLLLAEEACVVVQTNHEVTQMMGFRVLRE